MAGIWKSYRRAWKRVTGSWRRAVIDSSPPWLTHRFWRVAAWLEMLFVDHGIFRLLYLNKHRIDARTWRAAQPAPNQLNRIARSGVRTIVNLRGAHETGTYWLEEEACRRLGLKLVNFQVRSRAAPERDELIAIRDLFANLEYPILMHCKSGADRAGLMSVLYAHLVAGEPIDKAMGHLSLWYGHVRHADTGILDRVFEAYVEHCRREPMPFMEWAERVYDPEAISRSFKADTWANRIVNGLLRRE
jgi:protein tyrosine/serine phosphatase